MDRDLDPTDQVARSRRLTAASRSLVQSARRHIEATAQRLERARNVLQAVWLQRALWGRRHR